MHLARFRNLKRIPRSLRYKVTGFSFVPCELLKEQGNCHIIVKLLADGAGYKEGHIIAIGKSDLSISKSEGL